MLYFGLEGSRSERQHTSDTAFKNSVAFLGFGKKSVQMTFGPGYDSEACCGTDLYCTEHHVLPLTRSQLRLLLHTQKASRLQPSSRFQPPISEDAALTTPCFKWGKSATNSWHVKKKREREKEGKKGENALFGHGWTLKCRQYGVRVEILYAELGTASVIN